MYTFTDTKAYYITPESTPVKRSHNRLRGLSGAPISSSDVPVQPRRLPRKPSRPPPSSPESLEPETKHRSTHPVDAIIHIVLQSYLNFIVIAGEEFLRSPISCIRNTITRLTIFIMRLITVGISFGLWIAKVAMFITGALTSMMYHVSTRSIKFWMLEWHKVMQLCSNVLQDDKEHPLFDDEAMPIPIIDSTPRRADSSTSISLSPCGRGNICPPSPRSLRKPRCATTKSSPRRSMNTLRADKARGSTVTTRSSLGHRVESDFHRILEDCSEAQLEEAGRLIHSLQMRARARAGWKL